MKRMRGIFYESKTAFENNASNVAPWIKRLSTFWGVHSSAFNVLPCPKGLVAGPIRIKLKENFMARDVIASYKEISTTRDNSRSTHESTQTTTCDSQTSSVSSQTTIESDTPMADQNENNDKTDSMSRNLSAASHDTMQSIGGSQVPCDTLIYTPTVIEDISIIEEVSFMQAVPWVLIIEKDTIITECVQKLNQALQSGSDNGGKGYGILITVSLLNSITRINISFIDLFLFSKGKGFPDFATRRFVDHLRNILPVE